MAHRVVVICEGQQLDGWISYSITTSMITAAGTFTLGRPFANDSWRALRLDAKITILIDGTKVLTGIIDRRRKVAKTNVLEVSGRSIYGRLVQESAPTFNYEKLSMLEAIKRLASPHIPTIATSDATNRQLRRGKGRKVPAGKEPLVINLPVPKLGRVHPGRQRASIIEDITSRAGYLVWESADGNTLVVGKPNHGQAPQFLVANVKTGALGTSTAKNLEFVEDNGDRYSLIAVVGSGAGFDASTGDVTSRGARAVDFDSPDGTGGDFLRPKRLLMPERDFDANQDAQRVADREMARRDFRRTTLVATMRDHGQVLTGSTSPTLYAPNTVARVIDEDFEPVLDDTYLIHTVTFDGTRQEQSARLEMVPTGTEIVP